MLKKLKNNQGFTLIEVVIVLAIAALIILVVLQAVAGAQRSQRDTSRKNDAGRLVSVLEQYASNKNGGYPSSGANLFGATGIINSYDAGLATKYTNVASCGTSTSSTYEMVYAPAGNTFTVAGTTYSRDYTLSVCLEGGGSAQIK